MRHLTKPDLWFLIALLLVTGILATAAGFFVQTYAQQRLPAVQAAVIIVTEPVFAAFFGYLLVGDRLTALQIFGASLMVGALVLSEVCPRLARSPSRSSPEGHATASKMLALRNLRLSLVQELALWCQLGGASLPLVTHYESRITHPRLRSPPADLERGAPRGHDPGNVVAQRIADVAA